jgi:SAM-dependent methyltransferase
MKSSVDTPTARGQRTLAAARPLWRRVASRVRRGLHRAITPIDRMWRGRGDSLLPPAHLRIYYYRTLNPDAFARACRNASQELIDRGLRPEHRVLDIGSGIGNLAIGLRDYLRGGYDGVEIHAEAVAWCQRAITPRHPGFRFHHADLASGAYNPAGKKPSSAYRFPFPDRSFDFILLYSVFTHMLPAGVERYVREIARLLAPDGVCVASYFLLNDESRAGVEAHRSFMTFDVPHPSGLCRLHDAVVPEAAVAIDEAFVRRIHEEPGLRIHALSYGKWWNGVGIHHDVVTAVPREPGTRDNR